MWSMTYFYSSEAHVTHRLTLFTHCHELGVGESVSVVDEAVKAAHLMEKVFVFFVKSLRTHSVAVSMAEEVPRDCIKNAEPKMMCQHRYIPVEPISAAEKMASEYRVPVLW